MVISLLLFFSRYGLKGIQYLEVDSITSFTMFFSLIDLEQQLQHLLDSK
jgi:hypothetical protein